METKRMQTPHWQHTRLGSYLCPMRWSSGSTICATVLHWVLKSKSCRCWKYVRKHSMDQTASRWNRVKCFRLKIIDLWIKTLQPQMSTQFLFPNAAWPSDYLQHLLLLRFVSAGVFCNSSLQYLASHCLHGPHESSIFAPPNQSAVIYKHSSPSLQQHQKELCHMSILGLHPITDFLVSSLISPLVKP